MNNFVLECADIEKTYPHQSGEVRVLNAAALSIKAGELVALVGPSGSGKSTFLHIAGLLDGFDAGALSLFGQAIKHPNDNLHTKMRREKMGFVYQAHHLLPELSAAENVALPLMLNHMRKAAAIQRAQALLAQIGLEDRATHKPSELSGGEAQRVAIARALVHQPKLVLADEPTGNLDPQTTQKVMAFFIAQCRANGAAALVVTHNLQAARMLDRVMVMQNGLIAPAPSADPKPLQGV
jgi:lipoprotein-releasing system ATP-binding protein